MVIADLILITPRHICSYGKIAQNLDIEMHDRTRLFPPRLYKDGFKWIQRKKGIWYRIYPPKDQAFANTFFDIERFDNNGKAYVALRETWKDAVVGLICSFLQDMPNEHVAVLIRLDYPTEEIVHEDYSVERYLGELASGRIVFDEIYLIQR